MRPQEEITMTVNEAIQIAHTEAQFKICEILAGLKWQEWNWFHWAVYAFLSALMLIMIVSAVL
jgi:hypothetical protein